MTQIRSQIDPRTDAFRRNHERMAERLAQVQALQGQVVAESASKQDKFEKKGQLLPRERVARLLDRGSSFLELSALAGLGMHDDDGKKSVLGGGSIVGIGQVAGKRVLISASDSAVKGGTVAPMGLKKGLRAQAIALQNKLPLVSLVESGGANLMYQADIFVDGGRSFANQARLSAAGIPQIAVVHGSSTAGGAYLPGLSDYVVLVKDRSSIYLAGPPLVKAAIGEDTTDDELGGSELHARVTGLGEYLAENDAHAIAIARDLMDHLPWDEAGGPDASVRPPLYDAEELLGIVPADEREPYDAREIIARVVDGSHFLEFKAAFDSDTVCGHARINGHRSASSPTTARSSPRARSRRRSSSSCATRAARRWSSAEHHRLHGGHGGRARRRHQARQQDDPGRGQCARAQVHHRAGRLVRRGQLRHVRSRLRPGFIFSWPSARTAVMGGAQAAMVMEMISRGKLERAGVPLGEQAEAGIRP
jgi:geranyl-CoA carboxylase beta subunit